jgi:hypothetical protein
MNNLPGSDGELVELPNWVQRAVLPQRTRDAISAELQRELLLAGACLVVVTMVGVVWVRSAAPFPIMLWLNLAIAIGAVVRWLRLSSARRWIDTNVAWGTVAALPKSAAELRLERWRISDASFWSIVLAVVAGAVTLAIVIIGQQS